MGCKIRTNFRHNKYLFIDQGLSGAISYSCKRFSKSNNNYMNIYDPTRESKFIMYLDANNLYFLAMAWVLLTNME